jgi:replicative DNA helicase
MSAVFAHGLPRDVDDFPLDRQVAQLRIPPHSIEAESSVLGGLLLDNGAWDRVGDLLVDSDFYRYEHRLIYGAVGALINASKPADVITVFEHLQNQGKADGVWRAGVPEFSGPVRSQRQQHPALCRDRARTLDPAQTGQRQR